MRDLFQVVIPVFGIKDADDISKNVKEELGYESSIEAYCPQMVSITIQEYRELIEEIGSLKAEKSSYQDKYWSASADVTRLKAKIEKLKEELEDAKENQ